MHAGSHRNDTGAGTGGTVPAEAAGEPAKDSGPGSHRQQVSPGEDEPQLEEVQQHERQQRRQQHVAAKVAPSEAEPQGGGQQRNFPRMHQQALASTGEGVQLRSSRRQRTQSPLAIREGPSGGRAPQPRAPERPTIPVGRPPLPPEFLRPKVWTLQDPLKFQMSHMYAAAAQEASDVHMMVVLLSNAFPGASPT